MGKFSSAEELLYSVFGGQAWVAENVPTFPSNFTNGQGLQRYIRVTPICSGAGVNVRSVSGLLNIDIFTKAGEGYKDTNAIADAIDKHFAGKAIKLSQGSLQCLSSTLTHLGRDADNPALHRSLFSVPFNFYGDI